MLWGCDFRGSLNHLAGFRTDFLSALCLTVSELLASQADSSNPETLKNKYIYIYIQS